MIDILRTKLKEIHNIFEISSASITTEEATKNALVMPMLQILGYNVFNPAEVIPEYTTDIGIKKGEKVDYALMENGEPIILVECKHCEEDLDKHTSQLYRYFGASSARIGILTNGLEYRVFTDLENKNVMDKSPFFTFNIESREDTVLTQLSHFHKANFNSDNVIKGASSLKRHLLIEQAVKKELESPSDVFIRMLVKTGFGETRRVSEQMLVEFRPIIRKSIDSIISKEVSLRLSNAIEKTEPVQEKAPEPVSDIITTQDELDGYQIVKAIASQFIDPERVILKDAKTYCAILIDNNNRKAICRMYFDKTSQYITITNAEKVETKYPIEKISDIYKCTAELIESVKKYI